MEVEKKKNNIWVIVLLVLIILGLAGYICYDKLIIKKSNKNNMPSSEIENLGQTLFNLINFSDSWGFFGHYPFIGDDQYENANDNKYIDKLDDNTKYEATLLSLFRSIEKPDMNYYNEEKCYNSDFYNMNSSDDTPISECIITKISKAFFGKEYYKLFGKELINYPDHLFGYPAGFEAVYCQLENDVYVCYKQEVTVGDMAECYGGYKYVGAKINNSNLIVEAKPYAYNCFGDLNEEEYIKGLGKKNVLVTFAQNNNADWYWVSTEFVK